MTMLSRVANRLYWMARYLERAEDTARLVASYHMLIMDIPRGSELGWDVLLRILDAEPQFYARYRVPNENNVVKFLVADRDNPGSIASSVHAARENVRTTRDVLPEESWEVVNELNLYVREAAEKSIGRRNRQVFLDEVVGRCQMIHGMLETTLSRDHSYRFTRIGQLLERCDMTTRVIDVGVVEIRDRESHHAAIDPLLWSTLLQSMSALGAYRREVGPILEGHAIADFVLKDALQPRSTAFCLRGIREELKPLPHNAEALRQIDRARRKLARFNASKLSGDGVHRFVDGFQVQLSQIHQTISDTWFQTGVS